MKKEIILIGGGGHCHSVIDVIESTGEYCIAGIVDTAEKVGQKVLGYEIIGTDQELPSLAKKYQYFTITAGQIKSAALRIKLYDLVKKAGGSLPSIIASSAYVSKHSSVAEGTVIMHRAMVNAGAQVGVNCIINTGALIEHDAIIGNYSHISTHAVINGGVTIEDACLVGSNSVVIQGTTIGYKALIGAGSTVIRDIPSESIAFGNPTKLKS